MGNEERRVRYGSLHYTITDRSIVGEDDYSNFELENQARNFRDRMFSGKPGDKIVVLPNRSRLLELRKRLAKWASFLDILSQGRVPRVK